MVDLIDFGIPRAPTDDPWSNILGKVLWTFRGRFRDIRTIGPEIPSYYGYQHPETQPRIYLYSRFEWQDWASILHEEAVEIVGYTKNKLDAAEIAACFWYVLGLCFLGSMSIDFNWVTHVSNYIGFAMGLYKDTSKFKHGTLLLLWVKRYI